MKPPADSSLKLNFAPPRPLPTSRRTRRLARWFGLPTIAPKLGGASSIAPLGRLLPAAGEILLLVGASGAGKSSLLRSLLSATSADVIDLAALPLPDRPTVDCFEKRSMRSALRLLSVVGLAEAWLYLRTPAQLSEGQRWRLRLGLALAAAQRKARPLIVCDEFAAVLDRVTAAVISHALRRAIRPPISAVIATAHDDLERALKPDRVLTCDFGTVEISEPRERRCAA